MFPTFAPLERVKCCCSSVVEHFLGKEEVTSSSLVNSSKRSNRKVAPFFYQLPFSPQSGSGDAIARLTAQLLLDTQQLIILRHTVRARQ